MELLGEIYARGAGIERNFTKTWSGLLLHQATTLFCLQWFGLSLSKDMEWRKNYTRQKSILRRLQTMERLVDSTTSE
ncbi:hypothetical protein HAX54_018074 [Datura stramonium]|uniref:Uncharacterized protein n=1 Tax=Datura stramonium TaxID=4076 RepID=A0ABS8S163_DATST|nr:hypothetical protein [Datura stramonium]